jgi:threonine dehydratase
MSPSETRVALTDSSPFAFSRTDLDYAAAVVAEAFAPTPQIAWPLLASRTGAEVWVKHENHLPTGAFKVRGGLVFTARLRESGKSVPGLVSATRGNHGQSLAFAGQRAGIPVTIVVPHGNSSGKNAAMRAFGARLIEHGEDFDAAREKAMELAGEGMLFVPSFHPDLVLGVATWALELFTAVDRLDAVFVPIGLGSGICATIAVRDVLGLSTQIIGVQSTGADSYARSFAAGHVVPTNRADTRADGMATRMPDPDALAIIRRGASRIVTVADEEIAAAIRAYWDDTHNLAEGAAAAPLAAVLRERERWAGKRVGLVMTGGNIDPDLFRQWVLGTSA